jgi:hypothetical protein
VFKRTAQTVLHKFTVQLVVILLNKQNSEMQNCITAAESCGCFVVQVAKLCDKVQRRYSLEYGGQVP